MITEEFKNLLLHKVDIVDVIGSHVDLKKRGGNYVGLCPFHDEKTPSFTVSSPKQFYYCFGCGAKGDVISFLINKCGFQFTDAISELAKIVGLEVPKGEKSYKRFKEEDTKIKKLKEVLLKTARFYKQNLKDDKNAVSYLKKREISGTIAAKFHLGVASNNWQGLSKLFDNYNSSLLQDAGIVLDSDPPGKKYDRFRSRLIFPIINLTGEVIGFGGRSLRDENPKYLNSPETELFSKSREFYGLFEAKEHIIRSEEVVIVEGYFDVISLSQFSIKNVVATLGTSFTLHHFQKLTKWTKEIIFMFDGDLAGKKAAARSLLIIIPLMKSHNIVVKFVFLPSGYDPDTYIRKFGFENLKELINKAIHFSNYLLSFVSEKENLEVAEGRATAISKLKKILKDMPSGILKNQIIIEATKKFMCSPDEISMMEKKIEEKNFSKNFSFKKSNSLTSTETKMMAVLIRIPSKLNTLKEDDRRWFLSSYSSLLSWLQDFNREGDYNYELKKLREHFEISKHLLGVKDKSFFLKAFEIILPFDDSGENAVFLEKEFNFLYKSLKIKHLEDLANNLAKDEKSANQLKEIRDKILVIKTSQIE